MISSKPDLRIRTENIREDASEVVRIQNHYDTEPLSVEDFIRLSETWPAEDPKRRFIAETKSGQVLGFAHCRRRSSMTAGKFFLNIYVDPEHVGKGTATALLAEAEAFARSQRATNLTAFVTESDPHGQKFADKNGYVFSRHLFESVLNVDKHSDEEIDRIVAETSARAGVRFTSLEEFGRSPENEDALYQMSYECDLDEPTSQEFGLMSREDYQRLVLDAPWFRTEGTILAVAGDEWVASHVLGPSGDEKGEDFSVDYTGVLRPYRGKGVAFALKLLGVKYARSQGGKRMITHNDSTNEAMLAVNRKLGYVPQPGTLFMTKLLDGAEDRIQ